MKRHAPKLAVAVLVAAGIIAAWFSPLRAWLDVEVFRSVVAEIREAWWAPLVFIAAYGVGQVVFIPATLFILTAGVVWGAWLGGLYSVLGAGLGAALAWLAGVILGEGILDRLPGRGAVALDRLRDSGFQTMFFLRLIPGIPFTILSYGAGVAGLRFRDLFWGTVLGTAPSQFAAAYLADALLSGAITREEAMQKIAGICLALAVLVIVPLVLKRRLAGKQGAVGAAVPEP